MSLLPTAEPFFFLGRSGQAGCLLVHGFTGTPKEMRWMGEYLAGQGYTSLGVRLAGHATRPDDMIRSRHTDWMASVEDGYHLLHGIAPRVYLVGLSMGGVLSLLMSTRLDVKGVVAMSTPYGLPRDYPLWLLHLLSFFERYAPKTRAAPGAGWFDREAWKDHVSYPRNPVRSVAELKLLTALMRRALPSIRVPVLLIHSRDDSYVLPENATRIHEALTTPDRELMWISGSGHVITRDAQRAAVFEAARTFIRRVEAQA